MHSCLVGKHGAIDCKALEEMLAKGALSASASTAAASTAAASTAAASTASTAAAEGGAGKHDNEPSDLPLLGPAVPVRAYIYIKYIIYVCVSPSSTNSSRIILTRTTRTHTHTHTHIHTQVLLKAGDTVLLHPDLAHTGGPNFGCNIRSMVYFRVKSSGRSSSSGSSSSSSSSSAEEWQAAIDQHCGDMWADFGPQVRAAALQLGPVQ